MIHPPFKIQIRIPPRRPRRAGGGRGVRFFAQPQGEEEAEAPMLVDGRKQVGGNGDIEWVEYLLLGITHASVVPVASASSSN